MRIFLIISVFLAVQYTAQSQAAVTLLTFESYTFADKFETYYGTGKVQDGFQWGGGFEFGDPNGSNLELFYQRFDAEAVYSELGQQYAGKVGFNYIMLGGTRYAPMNEKTSGFGSFDMGVGWADAKGDNLQVSSVAKFTLAGRAGVRIAPSDKVSMRLHAQLTIPLQWVGGGVWFGTGGGGAGVSGGTTIVQFNLGGSVNIRLR